MAPNGLQVADVGTHKCNITWKVPQSSHYIKRYLEFEARKRSPGHSWEVSAPPGPTCPGPSLLSWSPCPSFTPQGHSSPRQPQPLLCTGISSLLSWDVPPHNLGVLAGGGGCQAGPGAGFYIATRQVIGLRDLRGPGKPPLQCGPHPPGSPTSPITVLLYLLAQYLLNIYYLLGADWALGTGEAGGRQNWELPVLRKPTWRGVGDGLQRRRLETMGH